MTVAGPSAPWTNAASKWRPIIGPADSGKDRCGLRRDTERIQDGRGVGCGRLQTDVPRHGGDRFHFGLGMSEGQYQRRASSTPGSVSINNLVRSSTVPMNLGAGLGSPFRPPRAADLAVHDCWPRGAVLA